MKYSPIFETELLASKMPMASATRPDCMRVFICGAVDAVEEHRAEPDDGAEDVQHEHELVEAAVDTSRAPACRTSCGVEPRAS